MTLKQLKKALKSKGVSQREFAAKLGVSESQLCQWFSGYRTPSRSAMKAIELVFKLNYEREF